MWPDTTSLAGYHFSNFSKQGINLATFVCWILCNVAKHKENIKPMALEGHLHVNSLQKIERYSMSDFSILLEVNPMARYNFYLHSLNEQNAAKT